MEVIYTELQDGWVRGETSTPLGKMIVEGASPQIVSGIIERALGWRAEKKAKEPEEIIPSEPIDINPQLEQKRLERIVDTSPPMKFVGQPNNA